MSSAKCYLYTTYANMATVKVNGSGEMSAALYKRKRKSSLPSKRFYCAYNPLIGH